MHDMFVNSGVQIDWLASGIQCFFDNFWSSISLIYKLQLFAE